MLRELRELVGFDQAVLRRSLAERGIKWTFNPPLAPHFGGVHEIMIKSAKRATTAILGNAAVSDEELVTAFTGAESLINSRPLTYQSASPDDETPLTPNHLLHGQVGGHLAPDCDPRQSPERRWRHVQELVKRFWHRWLREWIPMLNRRKMWLLEQRDVQPDDVGLLIQPDSPRGHWPLARVLETYPGQDGKVRVIKVQVGERTLVRPVTRLCPLEL